MADRDILADIAAVLALLTGARLIAALATLLLALIPRRLRAEEPELSAELAERVAKDVGSLAVPDAFDGERIRRDAARDALQYRAEYAVAALTRLTSAVSNAERGKRREALSRAYRAERRYLQAHRDASERRARASETTTSLIEQYGTTRLRWRWGATRRPAEPRPSHKRADGRVFDVRDGVPAMTGAMPGTLPGCSCAWEVVR